MNANLREIMHRELDILLNAVEYFEGDSVCCPTLKIVSEKLLGGEEVDSVENYASVIYDTQFVAQIDGSFEVLARIRHSELFNLTEAGTIQDTPYSIEDVEILEDGSEEGAII